MRRGVAFLALAVVCGPAARIAGADLTIAIAPEQVIARGETWRFLRGRAAPAGSALDWTRLEFDDGAWETGAAGFGYGDGDDATTLIDMEDRYSSVYIRKRFEVADPARAAALRLVIDYDDGFVAFLNGVEIARAGAGPPGTVPAFDDLATHTHEAGTPQAFVIAGAATLLAAGTNILAVVGFNDDLGSSDFSLHPELRAGGALAEGCPGDFYAAAGGLLLAGAAPAGTSAVRVNGAVAELDPALGTWTYRTVLAGSSASFAAEALDGTGAVIATATLHAVRARPLAGILYADLALETAEGPFLVVDELAVPALRRLTIEAGCDIAIGPGVGFAVEGEIRAIGAVEQPIRFTRVPCQENWGFFSFEDALGENVFRYCEWSHGGGDPGCLTLTGSTLELYGCTLRDIAGEGVHAVGCTTRIRACLIERTEEALSLDRGDTVVEFCTVRDVVEKSDLIDVNGAGDGPAARIAFNLISGTTDDGIDADGGIIVIEGNVIHGCGDQAMSLVGAGASTVRRNVCYGNTHGLSVKDSNVCLAEHNTFAFNAETGVRAIEKTLGEGGGIVTLRDSIVWGNGVQLLVEADGSIDAAYCDVEGGVAPGPGNISADPLFADAPAGDFNLLDGSPCIGAASDGGIIGALPLDASPQTYLRGDANLDSRLDLADPVRILAYLFEGGAALPCRETADANTDGRVDLSDAVFLLRLLFGGGPAPEPEDADCAGG